MRIFKALLFALLLPQLLLSQTAALHSIDVTDLDRKVDPMALLLNSNSSSLVGSGAETPFALKNKES